MLFGKHSTLLAGSMAAAMLGFAASAAPATAAGIENLAELAALVIPGACLHKCLHTIQEGG